MRKRWKHWKLKWTLWRVLTRELWRAERLTADVSFNTDDRFPSAPQYPGATSVHLIVNGRPSA